MPAKKRTTAPSGPITMFSTKGTQVEVAPELKETLERMGFTTSSPAPGEPGDAPPKE